MFSFLLSVVGVPTDLNIDNINNGNSKSNPKKKLNKVKKNKKKKNGKKIGENYFNLSFLRSIDDQNDQILLVAKDSDDISESGAEESVVSELEVQEQEVENIDSSEDEEDDDDEQEIDEQLTPRMEASDASKPKPLNGMYESILPHAIFQTY